MNYGKLVREVTWLRGLLFLVLLFRVKWMKETADKVTTMTTTMTGWEWKEALKTKRGEWKRRRRKLLRLLRERREGEGGINGGGLRE